MAAISKALSASELKNWAAMTVKNARRWAEGRGAALITLIAKKMLAVTRGQMFKLQHHRQIGGIEGKVKRGRSQ